MPVVDLRLRQTALKRNDGTFDLEAIFNLEIYPAIHKLKSLVGTGGSAGVFEPVFLTGAANTIIAEPANESHQSKHLLVSHTDSTVLTMPLAASIKFPLGTVILVSQQGVGPLTIDEGAGVTFYTKETTTLAKQFSTGAMLKISDTEWWLVGDFAPLPGTIIGTVVDSFIGGNLSATGNNTNANIGELQWNTARATADGTVARIASESGHMGIVRLTGNAGTGSHQAMYLGHAATSGSVIQLDEVDSFSFTVRNIGVGRFRFGLGDDSAAAGLGNNALVVLANADVESTWHVQTRAGGVITDIATAVPINTDWRVWKIQLFSSSEIRFYADDVLIHTATTVLPSFSTFMAPAVQVVTFTPGPFQGIGDIDTFLMQLKPVPA